MRIEKDFKEFIALLNTNKVRYMIVGGFAFSFHAEPRFTKDIDIFILTDIPNSRRILKSVEDFGFTKSGLTKDDFISPGRVIQLGHAPVRIDIVTSIDGVGFADAWKKRVTGNYGGVPAFFISKNDLIKNKLSLKRPQDLVDVRRLREI